MLYLNPKGLAVLFFFIVNVLISPSLIATPLFAPQYSVFSRDGSQLISVNAAGNEIVKQHARTGKVSKRIPLKLVAGSALLAPTPDGFKLLAVHAKGIDVIHNGTGKKLRTLPHPSGRYDWKGLPIQQNTDGSLLAIPSIRQSSPKIYLIHTGSGKIIRTLNLVEKNKRWKPRTRIGSIGFSANKRLLAYTLYHHKKGTLILYDINKQQVILRLDMPITPPVDKEMMSFSQNNQMLVISGKKKKSITLVDLQKKKQHTLPYPHSHFVNFTPDNKHLLIIQPSKQRLTMRNIKTGKQTLHIFASKMSGNIATIVQSYNKARLALPLISASQNEAAVFILINGVTGAVVH
jgi:WD40 repeat protein